MAQNYIVANNKFSSKEYNWKFYSQRVPKYDDTYTVAPTASNQNQWKFEEEVDKEKNEKMNKQKKMQNKKDAKERREKKEQKKRAQAKVEKEKKAQEEANMTMKSLLIQFQDKLDSVQIEDPIGKASNLVRTFTSLSDNAFAIQCAEHAFLVLKIATNDYTKALEENITSIQANFCLDPSDLIKIPEYPVLPPVFFEELQKAKDRKAMELDNECPICQDNMRTSAAEELFRCPTCQKFAHLECLQQWWDRSNSCPCCRTQWN